MHLPQLFTVEKKTYSASSGVFIVLFSLWGEIQGKVVEEYRSQKRSGKICS